MHISGRCVGRIVVGDGRWTRLRRIAFVRMGQSIRRVLDQRLRMAPVRRTSGWTVNCVLRVGHLSLVQIRLLRARSLLLWWITVVRIDWTVSHLWSRMMGIGVGVGDIVLVHIGGLIGPRLTINWERWSTVGWVRWVVGVRRVPSFS